MHLKTHLFLLVSLTYICYSSSEQYPFGDPRRTDFQHYSGCIGTKCQDVGTQCQKSYSFGTNKNRCEKADGSYGESTLCCQPNSPEGKFLKKSGTKGTNEYPFVVYVETTALLEMTPQGQAALQEHCTGSIYNNEWILTAGHCVTIKNGNKVYFADSVKIITGASHLMQVQDADRVFMVTNKNNIFRHTSFDMKTGLRNDLALIKLDNPIPKFNKYVQPIRMALSDEDPYKTKIGIPLGYGYGPFGYSPDAIWGYPLNLTQPNADKSTGTYCEGVAGHTQFDADNKICVGGFGTGGIGKGHSGGPLVCLDESGSPYQCGVCSAGAQGCEISDPDCDKRMEWPSVYTNLASYIDWVQKTTKAKQSPRYNIKKLKYPYVKGKKWSKRQ